MRLAESAAYRAGPAERWVGHYEGLRAAWDTAVTGDLADVEVPPRH